MENDTDSKGRAKNGMRDDIATGPLSFRNRSFRWNLLFLLTLFALVLVFIGAAPFGEALMAKPALFTLFWAACFFLVGLILVLALYDLMRVRRDLAKEARTLEKEVAVAASEARERLRKAGEGAGGADQG